MNYAAPVLENLGAFTQITAADQTSSARDKLIAADGSDLNPGNLVGSGDACIDANNSGICDYQE